MLLHIGYHKTASTWLQQNFFNNPANGFYSPYKSTTLIQSLIHPRPFDFDINQCQKNLTKLFVETEPGTAMPVLSLEALSGNPHLGGFNNIEAHH